MLRAEENGLGVLEVYAGGCALSEGYQSFYYRDEDDGLNSGRDIIVKKINDLFEYIAVDKKHRNGYTIYAHNLARFDSVPLIKSLATAGYELKAKWKDNAILS